MANGWWNLDGAVAGCVAAYEPIGAANLAASYVNKVGNAAYDCTVWTGKTEPLFNTLTGWELSIDPSRVLDTGIVGANGISAIVRFSDSASVQQAAIFGVTVTVGVVQFNIINKYTDNKAYFRAGGTYNTDAGTNYLSGVLAVTPAKAYVNGSPIGNLASPYSGTTTVHVAIGGQAINATAPSGWIGKIQAIAFYSSTPTDDNIAALTIRMNALPVATGSVKIFPSIGLVGLGSGGVRIRPIGGIRL